VRTTLSINDALLRELRDRAAASGSAFRQVLEEALALGLARQAKTRRPRKIRIKPHRLGLKPGFRGMSLNQLYDQIEAEGNAQRR
jgi:hypothetical protein